MTTSIDSEVAQLAGDDQADELDEQPAPEPDRAVRSQRVEVEMADGSKLRVRITNRDRLQWDKVAPRRKWGKATDVPTLAQTFVTWAALRREGLTDMKWETFEVKCVDLYDEPYDPEVDGARPTTRTAGGERS